MDLLRFITAGSVDDGKSTLIGRLLYDSKNVLVDQLDALGRQSRNKENGEIDLALLTDGLRAEREQGITIDVAYKYFSTPKRKFIIADAPGHIQYTRNMVTGASNASLIIVLVDARKGISEQTRRHSIIASLLGIEQVVVSVNKMDLVDFSRERYDEIVEGYKEIARTLGLKQVHYLPISALIGDNIVDSLGNMPWYSGPTLLELLETVPAGSIALKDAALQPSRLQVQYVIRPQSTEYHDYRGYAGRILSGTYSKDQQVSIYPSGLNSRIKTLELNGIQVESAESGENVIINFYDELDVSRGDLIVGAETSNVQPKLAQEFEALVCWMDQKPIHEGNRYIFQIGSKQVTALVRKIIYRLDVSTFDKIGNIKSAALNDIIRVSLKTASPIAYDAFNELKSNGSAILIDENTLVTVGACMLDPKEEYSNYAE